MMEKNTHRGAAPPRLLDQVRDEIRRRHYSDRTEQTNVHWIKRLILFSDERRPGDPGAPEVIAFLTHLARDGDIVAATRNASSARVSGRGGHE